MAQYEVMFIVRPDVEGEEAVDQQIERYGRLVVDNGGEVTGVDKWGRRRFAYEIQGLTEGYYVVIQFNATHNVVDEMDRIMRISDEIVRHLIVRLDESEAASEPEAEPTEQEASEEKAASEPVATGGDA